MERLLDPKNDWAFKQVFGQEKNKNILISFINTMLAGVQEPVEDVEFLKVETDSEITALRQSIVDVLCKTVSGNRYIVEMQKASDSGFIQRAIAYASRVYLNQRTKDQKEKNDRGGYSQMRPVIFLAIMEKELFPNKVAYLSHHKIQDIVTGECDIKLMSFSFLELSKVHVKFDNLNNDIDRWAYFFKKAKNIDPERLQKILSEGTIFGEAYKVLERSAYTPEQLLEYDRFELKEDEIKTRISDAVEAKERELKEKAETEKRESAMTALQMGLSNEQVSKITGLSIEEIQTLQ